MPKVLFVNVTRQCNVDCPRCYLTEQHRAEAHTLPLDSLKTVLTHSFWGDAPCVILQGGEATILGPARISEYVQAIRSVQPSAKITMVTNLLNMPDWLIDLAKDSFEGQIETTYATGAKRMLNGSEQGYQDRFRASLAKAIAAGLTCPINVELNRETFSQPVTVIRDLARETGARNWEFDISVRFDAFRQAPLFGAGNYPQLPLSITYAEFAEYIHSLAQVAGTDISTTLLMDAKTRAKEAAFNVQRESDFLTINPDGTVTTNPLFSDIRQTYLGNIREGLQPILDHPARHARILYEAKRLSACTGCSFLGQCKGGPSHVPVRDNSGECAGLKTVWSRINTMAERVRP